MASSWAQHEPSSLAEQAFINWPQDYLDIHEWEHMISVLSIWDFKKLVPGLRSSCGSIFWPKQK